MDGVGFSGSGGVTRSLESQTGTALDSTTQSGKITPRRKEKLSVVLVDWKNCFRDGLSRFLLLVFVLQFLAWLEPHSFAGRDVYFFARAGIAADAGLARLDAEHAEAAELDTLTAAERLLQGFKNRLDGLFRLGAADICR